MRPGNRQPHSCEFREIERGATAGAAICGLAARFADASATAGCRVDARTCDACCRYPLLTGPQLNPVVASLVFASASRADPAGANARQVVASRWSQQFARRWLQDAGGGPSPIASVSMPVGCESDAAGAEEDSTTRHPRENGRPPRIGLVGRSSRFGLGHLNRDIARYLDIDRWLIPRLPGCEDLPARDLSCRVDEVSRDLSPLELEAWIDGLDIVLFVETPVFSSLTDVARQMGVKVVCIPNWEWLHPGLDWLDKVDLMLCSTRHTAHMLDDWQRRFRFHWKTELLPWPVDTEHHHFRRRYTARRFVFVNGSGGAAATTEAGEPAVLHRKGLRVLLAAAREIPDVPFIVYASPGHWTTASRNVEFRPPPADNRSLYRDGDVCVQPSHWEGLGLPLLECQAAGMPLIATAAPPMDEYQPLAAIPATEVPAQLGADLCLPAARIDPDDLARVLKNVHGRNIFFASGRARRFITREHGWHTARPRLLRCLSKLVAAANPISGSFH